MLRVLTPGLQQGPEARSCAHPLSASQRQPYGYQWSNTGASKGQIRVGVGARRHPFPSLGNGTDSPFKGNALPRPHFEGCEVVSWGLRGGGGNPQISESNSAETPQEPTYWCRKERRGLHYQTSSCIWSHHNCRSNLDDQRQGQGWAERMGST